MTMEQEEKIFDNISFAAKLLIGSRAYGGYDNDSDYDFIMTSEQCEKMIEFLSKKSIAFSANGGGSENNDPNNSNQMYNTHNIKFRINGEIINLLGYREKDIPLMFIVDETMKIVVNTALRSNIIEDKRYRIEMFQAILRNIFNEYARPEHIEIDIDDDEIPF